MAIRIFRHYVSVPLLLLALGEVLVFLFSVYIAIALRFGGVDVPLQTPAEVPFSVFPRALVYAIIMWTALTAFGLYSEGQRKDEEGYPIRYLGGFALGIILIILLYYAIPHLYIGRGVLALAVAFSVLGSATLRHLFFKAAGLDILKRRVLVLGCGGRAAEIETLARHLGPDARFQVIGFVPTRNEKPEVAASRLLTSREPLAVLAQKHRAEEVVVGVRDRRNGQLCMPELLECKTEGINVIDISSFFERETGHVRIGSLNASWLVFSDGFRRDPLRDVVKRVFDIGVGGVLLAMTLPVMIVTAVAIFAESGGPIFYRQTRVGECGRPFRIWKFRSMRADAERDGVARWAEKNDSRVTRVGRLIRAARIDELPQLFNVLVGEMSFVGPRPERPEFIRDLEKQIPYYSSRHAVRPGITGWAQIRYPYGASVDDAMQKLQYDLYYVKNHTLFLDLVVLFQTAQVVLFGKGAR
jgi:sugar transferase (PEP-CTERM system associated)